MPRFNGNLGAKSKSSGGSKVKANVKANSKSNVKSNIKPKTKTPSKVKPLKDEVKKVYPPKSTEPSTGRIIFDLNNEIKASAENGQIVEALNLLNDMVARGYRPHPTCYSKIIIACKKVCDGERAFQTLELMVDRDRINPSFFDMRRVISTCGKAKLWERAVETFESMEIPDTTSFNTVILACERSQQWNKIIDIYNTMADKDVSPDEVTYSMVLKACEKGDKAEKNRLLHKLQLELVKSQIGAKLKDNESS